MLIFYQIDAFLYNIGLALGYGCNLIEKFLDRTDFDMTTPARAVNPMNHSGISLFPCFHNPFAEAAVGWLYKNSFMTFQHLQQVFRIKLFGLRQITGQIRIFIQ